MSVLRSGWKRLHFMPELDIIEAAAKDTKQLQAYFFLISLWDYLSQNSQFDYFHV